MYTKPDLWDILNKSYDIGSLSVKFLLDFKHRRIFDVGMMSCKRFEKLSTDSRDKLVEVNGRLITIQNVPFLYLFVYLLVVNDYI